MAALHRRRFLSSLFGVPAFISTVEKPLKHQHNYISSNGLKTSLNAFSFNDALLKGSMSITEMMEFCATSGFDGVDITGYYLKGYPVVPDDKYLLDIKRRAFGLGLEISGTGVRNDFTVADKNKRSEEVELVRRWVEVAAKMGAPVIRIFAGNQKNENIPKEKVTEWMLEDIRKCVEYGEKHGVIIGLQNHNDFIQTANQVINMIKTVNSEWLGLILDTGSFRVNDPYEEIEKSIKYAVNWQIKENVFKDGKEIEADIQKIISMIKAAGYKGYLPIETLGDGDPKIKIDNLFSKVKKAIG
jgi:sugar phosphate isomerase/epimerase